MKYRYYIPTANAYLWRQNKKMFELSGNKPDNWTYTVCGSPSQDWMDKFEISRGLAKLKYPLATII